MSHTLSRTAAEPVSERDAAWFEELGASIARGRSSLLAQQLPDGNWAGECEGGSVPESELVLLLAFLGRHDDPRIKQAANSLWARHLPGGGWSNVPGRAAEVSASVKAYFALKVAGHCANEPEMQRAAEVILALGGAEATGALTRFYLAILGQVPYSLCPSVPAEIVLLPRGCPLNLSALSAWSRSMIVPLSAIDAYQPVTRLPDSMHIGELFLALPETPRRVAKPTRNWFSWRNLFLGVDRCLKKLQRWGIRPLRDRAVRKAIDWMRARYTDNDGLGGDFAPLVYTVVALKCLGVPDNDAELVWVMKRVDDQCVVEDDALRIAPRATPVRDTAIAVIAAADAGLPGRALECELAVRWLLGNEVRRAGEWSNTVRGVELGGWGLGNHNDCSPNTDDSATVLLALARSGHALREASGGAIHRAVNWLVAMQNRDGGWAAFKRGADWGMLDALPLADSLSLRDPSCPGITAHVLEALSHYGFRVGQPPVDDAVRFILARQDASGAWFDRWGRHSISTTWRVLIGLHAIGFDMTALPVRRAVRWLKEAQNEDGGWGARDGESSASPTAWALMGLLAAGEARSAEARAGAEYLVGTQRADGGWTEAAWTGSGFPRGCSLKYQLDPVLYPLMALGRYAVSVRKPEPEVQEIKARVDAGHAVAGPKTGYRTTLAENDR